MAINVHLKCGRGCERGCGCGCGCNSNEKSWLISNAWNYEKCLGHQNANATLAINHLWPFVFQPSATLQLSAIRSTPPPQPPFPKSHWIIVALANGKILFCDSSYLYIIHISYMYVSTTIYMHSNCVTNERRHVTIKKKMISITFYTSYHFSGVCWYVKKYKICCIKRLFCAVQMQFVSWHVYKHFLFYK